VPMGAFLLLFRAERQSRTRAAASSTSDADSFLRTRGSIKIVRAKSPVQAFRVAVQVCNEVRARPQTVAACENKPLVTSHDEEQYFQRTERLDTSQEESWY